MASISHSPPRRIYLDNAATSWPKPESVYAAVDYYLRHVGAAAGRGGYRHGIEADRIVADARKRAAELLGAADPRHVVFTCSGTDALNLALHGVLRPGDHVVTTVAEHNSVLRPLKHLELTADVQVTRVGCGASGIVDPDDVRRAVTRQTRLVAMIHVSNVTGAVQPIEEVGRIARGVGALFLVDAAQSIGSLPADVTQWSADLVAAPAHKGMLAPLGLGILYVAPGIEKQLAPLRQGGTGTQSEQDRQPDSLPDKYEAGNHNVPAIAGLGAALAYLKQRGVESVREHERRLTERLLVGLAGIHGITIYGPADANRQGSVVSFNVAGYDPQEVAGTLDAAYAVEARAGFHCAPLMHQALGTDKTGGTVRLSAGPFSTEHDIDKAVRAVTEIASAAVGA